MDDGKSRIRPTETYVLDDDELEELDDASLTSIMREVVDPAEADGRKERRAEQGDNEFIDDYRDPAIDDLLGSDANSTGPGERSSRETGTSDEDEVLLPPSALFSADYGDDES